MPEIDFTAVLQMLASVGAKLLVLVFLSPFLILATTSTYAFAASQFGTFAGWAASILLVIFFALGLNHWLWIVAREKT
jgi:hypothetical protein